MTPKTLYDSCTPISATVTTGAMILHQCHVNVGLSPIAIERDV